MEDKIIGEPVDPHSIQGLSGESNWSIQTNVVLPPFRGTTDLVPEHSVWYFDFEGESFSTIKPKLQPF